MPAHFPRRALKRARTRARPNAALPCRRAGLGWLALAALGHLPAAGEDAPPRLPALGDASSGVVSTVAERELARAALRQIRASAPTVDDPILKYYVQVNVQRLAEHSALATPVLATVLIDSPQINAFAVPGGVVGINLGLFLHARDESEYSAVVAHELAHLSQRHYARQLEAQRALAPWRLAGLLAGIAIGAAGGGDAGMAALLGTESLVEGRALRFSRAREQEADRIGLHTLADAGLDPGGMARMFGRMRQAFRYVTKPPEFLLTHPLTETRIADAERQAARFAGKTPEPSWDYQFMRARAQVHFAESPRRALAQARARRGGGDADKYAVAVALARAGRPQEAADATAVLRARHPDSLLMAATHADALVKSDQVDAALALLARQLAINPDNEPLALLQAQALTAAGKPEQAVGVLRQHVRAHPNDPDVWVLLAETAGLAGDTLGVHRARAEYFALVGAHGKAIAHLGYARRLLAREEEQLRAGIDQRIVDLRTELEALDGERAKARRKLALRGSGESGGGAERLGGSSR